MNVCLLIVRTRNWLVRDPLLSLCSNLNLWGDLNAAQTFPGKKIYVTNPAPAVSAIGGCVYFISRHLPLWFFRVTVTPAERASPTRRTNQTHCPLSLRPLKGNWPIRSPSVSGLFEYSLLFAGFECHMVGFARKATRGRKKQFLQQRQRETDEQRWRWVKRVQNWENELIVGSQCSSRAFNANTVCCLLTFLWWIKFDVCRFTATRRGETWSMAEGFCQKTVLNDLFNVLTSESSRSITCR